MKASEKLSGDARSLLDALRAAEDPTLEDEVRVKRALDAAIAAGLPPHLERRMPEGGEEAAAPSGSADGLGAGGVKAAVVKGGVVAWGVPVGVLGLCAAVLFASGPGERSSAQAPAASAAPSSVPTEQAEALEPAAPDRAAPAPPVVERVPHSGDSRKSSARAPTRADVPNRRQSTAAERTGSNGLAAELELLQSAQAALRRGDGASALHALDSFRGSGGQLLSERGVARVLALCSLGRVAEARSLAAELVRAEPHSVQRAALERSCANPSRMGGR